MKKLTSFDPSSGQPIGEVAVANPDTVTATIEKSHIAAKKWRGVTIHERLSIIQNAYSKAAGSLNQLAELLSREMGKDIRRSTSEVQGTIWGGPYIAASAVDALAPKVLPEATVDYVPLGVAAIISPWNYPLAMANNLIIPALMAGNSVIWKPSEETPLIAQALYNILSEAFPEDLLLILHGGGEVGQVLVEGDVNIIGFTGSQATGRDIMARASTSLKRLVMELGGNDPMIVMEDANLESAARFAVASSFENAGQMCISTERIYVDRKIASTFEQHVVAMARQYSVGPWNKTGVNIGPIINKNQHQKISAHIQNALENGGRLLLGEAAPQPPYIGPTVIADMDPEMLIEQQETFGPVVCMGSYNDIEDAISRANNSDYGLGAVVFGGSNAKDVATRLEAGMIGINQGVGGGGDTPWVGAKQSGFGYHGSPEGHRQFAQVRVTSGSN